MKLQGLEESELVRADATGTHITNITFIRIGIICHSAVGLRHRDGNGVFTFDRRLADRLGSVP